MPQCIEALKDSITAQMRAIPVTEFDHVINNFGRIILVCLERNMDIWSIFYKL